MKIDDIEYQGDKLGTDRFYVNAVSYLNEKFLNRKSEFIKEWLLKRGTMLTPLTNEGIASEIVLFDEAEMKDKKLIFGIEECLYALSLYFKISDQRYHER